MPELPEVETIRRSLRPGLLGRRIEAVDVFLPKAAPDQAIMELLPGRTISGVGRRGKLLLLHVSDGLMLAFHLRMTGRLFLTAPDKPLGRHCRIRFRLDNGYTLLFDDARTFGMCRAMLLRERGNWPYFDTLGPEPLIASVEALADRFSKCRGNVKASLLDQTVLAGVGNIYADEALFLSRIHPQTKITALKYEQLVDLATSVQTVLREGIMNNGASIRDYVNSNGERGGFQNIMQAYGRKGKPCLVCGTILENARVAGRGTTFCPKCQPQTD